MEIPRRQSSFVFLSPVFWRALIWGLSTDWGSKALINLLISPVGLPIRSVAQLKGKVTPYPPGTFAITHVEHWDENWPDLEGGINPIAWLIKGVDMLLERFTSFDVPIELIFFAVMLSFPLLVGLGSIGQKRQRWTLAVALAFWVAGAIGNQGEVALFGHATDWIMIQFGSRRLFTNLADVMILLAMVMLFFIREPKKSLNSQKTSSP